AIDKFDLKTRISALLKLQSRVKPTEAAAENKDTRLVCHTDDLSQEQRNAYRNPKAAEYRRSPKRERPACAPYRGHVLECGSFLPLWTSLPGEKPCLDLRESAR